MTPFPEVFVYVPELWKDATLKVFDVLKQERRWNWNLATSPANADIVLAKDVGQYLVAERPAALVVPFSSPLAGIGSSEAERYLVGNDLGITAVDWPEIPFGFKALRVDGFLPDESGYPLLEQWSLIPQAEFSAAAVELEPKLREVLSGDAVVRMAAVGDVMLDRSLGYGILSAEPLYPFLNVVEILRSADIAIGNLESSLGDSGEPVNKSYNFQAPPEAALSLELAGFDVLSLANNHAMDFGPESLLQAIDLLETHGIETIGAGANESVARRPVIVTVNGIDIAFLAYVNVPVEVGGFDAQMWVAGKDNPGLSWANPEIIDEDVTMATSLTDVVVVILHSGYEFIEQPSPEQIELARAAIDAGASLVIGHHSHLLQGVEFYKDGVIVYGLGNFAFDMEGDRDSAILNVWLDQDGVRNLEYVPVTIGPGGQPGLATPRDSARILEKIYLLSDLLVTP
jgi:poly-gamma-glutamate synthesis protein (capsule biosynthesis protein)